MWTLISEQHHITFHNIIRAIQFQTHSEIFWEIFQSSQEHCHSCSGIGTSEFNTHFIVSKLFFERRLPLSINGFRTFEQFLNSHLNRFLPSIHKNYTKDSLFLQPVQSLFANFLTAGLQYILDKQIKRYER